MGGIFGGAFVFTAIMAGGFAIYAAFRNYPMIAVGIACLVPVAWWVVSRIRDLLIERELRQVRAMIKSGKIYRH
jgi:hypothetical protein